MVSEFQKFTQEANEFINELSLEFNGNQEFAYRALKTVFITTRELLTPDESLHLVAQLPIILKGIYVDNWKLAHSSNHRKIRGMDDFYRELINLNKRSGIEISEEEARNNFKVVFNHLKKYISEGELDDIRDQFPKEVKELI